MERASASITLERVDSDAPSLNTSLGRPGARYERGVEEIALLEDVEIEMEIPSKLTVLDFPRTEDGQEEDVAKVIRKSFSKFGVQYPKLDTLSSLADGGMLSWETQVEAAVENEDDEFWEKVAHKTNTLHIGKSRAIFEVYTDMMVTRAGDQDSAMLWLLRQDYKEFCMELFVIRLLDRGANMSTAGKNRNTPLHLAAIKGFTNVGNKLLEHGAIVMYRNADNKTPLELAVLNRHSDFAVLMIHTMEPIRVREIFQGNENRCCSLSLHSLLECTGMQGTIMAVLGTMMESLPGHSNIVLVHYSILDGDRQGRSPSDRYFNREHKSCLHKIAKSNNKEAVYHDVVRLLLRRKWKKFARYIFSVQFVFFLITVAVFTCALMLAAEKEDPRCYDSPVDVFRGICEGLVIIITIYNAVAELNQMRIHRQHYLLDVYNYLDCSALLCIFFIIPFRASGLSVQWIFASLGYLFNGLRAFKYASVFRSTGAYVQILYKVMLQDMIQFGAIFSVFLFSFSGAFYLALRGEERVLRESSNNTMDEVNSTSTPERAFGTNLDIYPYETSEFYYVLFTGLRVMIEGGSIVNQYFGPNGFRWLGVVIYLVFLFLVIVVLLNLLIAQMSDTYSGVHQDAQRSLAINRAWIVARVEHNSLIYRDYRKFFYKSCEVVNNPKGVLEKWEQPAINEVHKKIERLERALSKQQETLEDMRVNILEKLNEQSRMLHTLSEGRQ